VHGELWDAVAPAGLPAGTKVAVRSVEGLRLFVEPVGAREPVPSTLVT